MYLASQQAIPASAMAMSTRAKRRAFSSRVLPWSVAIVCAIWLYSLSGVPMLYRSYAQKYPIAVCSWVRIGLLTAPSVLTSLKAVTYSALPRAGGAGGRNCEPPSIENGVTLPHPAARADVKSGGVGLHSPGFVPGL